jgi:hypothetical protein
MKRKQKPQSHNGEAKGQKDKVGYTLTRTQKGTKSTKRVVFKLDTQWKKIKGELLELKAKSLDVNEQLLIALQREI